MPSTLNVTVDRVRQSGAARPEGMGQDAERRYVIALCKPTRPHGLSDAEPVYTTMPLSTSSATAE
jgi:hypothetical protein